MSLRLILIVFTLSLFVQVSHADDGSSSDDPAIRALLVTGGCCHDYENQKTIIAEGLSQRVGNIEWTLLDYADTRETKADIYLKKDWINDFDIVVHNECFGAVTDGEFVQSIVDAHVNSGVPAIMIHCSMHSYRTAPTALSWRKLIGVISPRHEKKRRSLMVLPTDEGKTNKITASLGDGWQTPNGELYLIETVLPETTVLATSLSEETGKDEPIVWTNLHQGVRVFATTLGHHNETMRSEPWQTMIAEGFKWALAVQDSPDKDSLNVDSLNVKSPELEPAQ